MSSDHPRNVSILGHMGQRAAQVLLVVLPVAARLDAAVFEQDVVPGRRNEGRLATGKRSFRHWPGRHVQH